MTTEPTAGTNCLQPISGGEAVIPACDGTETIADNGKAVFTGWIDPNFGVLNANERGNATPQTSVAVYEMIKNADFPTMFGSLSEETDKLALTQHQILKFVRNHNSLLGEEDTDAFFLFKSAGNFFVAHVHRGENGALYQYLKPFKYSYVWTGECRHRVIVPKLAA